MNALRVLAAAAAGWFAGLAFAPAFGGFPGPGPFLVAISAAAVAAVAVALLALALDRLAPLAAAGLGVLAVVAAALLVTGTGTDAIHGPWRLLTVALPADASGPALAAVAIVVGWATLAASLAAAYRSSPLPALAPVIVTVLGALALTASATPLPAWYAAVLVALLAGVVLMGSTPVPARRVAPAAVVTAVAAVAALLLGPTAPGIGARPAADARALVAAPVQPRSGVSPLQQYLALRDGTLPMRLTGEVSPAGAALRMATLTRFDGSYWTVAGDFRLAGHTLPPDPAASTASTAGAATVGQRVSVEAGELNWLVTAGRPTSVSIPGLGVEQSTGDVAVPVGAPVPTGYTATSSAPSIGVDQLLAADPAVAAQPLEPGLPAAARSFLDQTVADEPAGLDEILSLYRRLATGDEFRYDEADEVAGGHGYYQILKLLETRRGTSEQYASAFAVMVRALGYDARVVMGFLPRYDGERFVASGPDVAAWAEVRFDGVGWVTVDPSPRGNPIGTRPDAPAAGGDPVAPPDPLAGVPGPEATYPPDVQPPSDALAAAPGDGPVSWPLLAAVVGLGLVAMAGPAVRGVRRTRRRRVRSGRRAVLGAWWETVDLLRGTGVPAGPAMTTGEVVALAGPTPGLAELAAMVDEAAFAPNEPPAELRRRAWATERDVRHHLLGRLGGLRRLAVRLTPRR